MSVSREWIGRGAVLATLALVVALPFALRTENAPALQADDTVVIITPHNEAIRSEFARGFAGWYQERRGRSVAVDWRVIGGTSEITRFLRGEYTQAFQLHWTRDLGRAWTLDVQRAFADAAVEVDDTPADDTEAQAARRAFLASKVSCGIDLFFGGGTFDFIIQADAGRIVDSGIFERRPEWFSTDIIPETHGGERFWDHDHTWVGAVLSSFGILYNRDALRRLGVEHEPREWRDLCDPRYLGEVALADPTKSSSIGKAFEMVIQQEMQTRLRELLGEGVELEEAERRAVREGWEQGFQVLQLMSANARYFTDSSQKPPIDVGQGDAAAGLCIDFYGRYQAEAVGRRDETTSRLGFVTPVGGSVYSVDPIATMRGAPHRAVALDMIEYVLSPEGQKLWNYRVGEPGGPEVFALRRLPVRKDVYTDEDNARRSDATTNPFGAENTFEYRGAWTGGLFREMSLLVRIVGQDAHDELVAAWRAINAAGRPADALAVLQDMRAISYDRASVEIRAALRGAPMDEAALVRDLTTHFRAQYRRARELAETGRGAGSS